MALITLCRYPGKVPAGEIVFTASETWTVPRGVKKIDVFLVGGGGGGGNKYFNQYNDGAVHTTAYSGGGGGGGYTATHLNIDVAPKSQIAIVVGTGGTLSNPGSASLFDTFSVNGGGAGEDGLDGDIARGGAGGSGGGGGDGHRSLDADQGGSIIYANYSPGAGGTNGANGGNTYDIQKSEEIIMMGGTGQGTTTRAFGESDGALYASGGGGGAGDNGFGGNGSATSTGGNGVVIVRWAKQ